VLRLGQAVAQEQREREEARGQLHAAAADGSTQEYPQEYPCGPALNIALRRREE
jgi:hypothetical protein